MKLISQAAEAKIYLEGKVIVKDRITKGYRLPELDHSIRKSRTKREAKVFSKLGINHPKLISADETIIKMDFVEGKKIADVLNSKNFDWICRKMGDMVAEMHSQDIIHGDLTTSNMIIRKDKIIFIDFGLSLFSSKIEDKAVDIHLLRQALESKHYKIAEEAFSCFLEGYKSYSKFDAVIERFKKVEGRGRYKRKR